MKTTLPIVVLLIATVAVACDLEGLQEDASKALKQIDRYAEKFCTKREEVKDAIKTPEDIESETEGYGDSDGSTDGR